MPIECVYGPVFSRASSRGCRDGFPRDNLSKLITKAVISLNIANLQIYGRTFANKYFRLRLMYFLFVRCGFFGKG
jgi:hypothetical protein